jgi:hypothetical protein
MKKIKNSIYTGAAKREKEQAKSLRQEEIGICNKLFAQCDKCKYNKANCNEQFTCGASMCKAGRRYPCMACAFLKYVGSGSFEDQIHAPPYPCERFEEI